MVVIFTIIRKTKTNKKTENDKLGRSKYKREFGSLSVLYTRLRIVC
jgi:hypothetical protein